MTATKRQLCSVFVTVRISGVDFRDSKDQGLTVVSSNIIFNRRDMDLNHDK